MTRAVIALAVLLLFLSVVQSCSGAARAAPWPGAVVLQFIGSPSMVTIEDWTFLNVTGYNNFSSSLNVVMFAVWMTTDSGTIVAVETGGSSVAAEQAANFYVPVYDIGAGAYTVTVFGVVVQDNNPVTLPLQLQVTLS